MQLETLEVLLAIEAGGSTRKAADKLCTSFQNVSRVLNQAEDEWGVRLFDRGSKGLTPTEDGQIALLTAREILRLYNDMLDQFQYRRDDDDAPNNNVAGKLELVSSIMTSTAFLNDVLLEFSIQYPRINVDLAEEDAYLLQNNTTANIALAPRIMGEPALSEPNVVPLLKDEVVLLVKKNSSFAKQRSISLKRVTDLPLVLVGKHHWEESAFGHILRSNHLEPQNVTFTSNVIGFQKYLDSGQYVGLATEIIARKLMSDKRLDLKIISIRSKSVSIAYCMTIRNLHALTEPERCFIDFMKENFHIGESK